MFPDVMNKLFYARGATGGFLNSVGNLYRVSMRVVHMFFPALIRAEPIANEIYPKTLDNSFSTPLVYQTSGAGHVFLDECRGSCRWE